MNAMKRFALLGTALMSFLTGCGTQQEHTASSQPKAAASSDTVKEIAQTGMSTAVPDEYLQPIEQAGTVTQITYDSKDFVRDGSVITKTAYVYLPYGYDENDTATRYDICYLMHGWGGHASEYFQYANITDMLDNMIAKGDIPPTIFVSATFYNDNSDTDFSSSVAEFRQFHRDFEEYLMPAVEGQFHTYAKSTSPDDLKASRDYRAFGGFSLGSVTTWLQFCYDFDYIRCFLPMSGSCWYYGGYGDFQIEKNVDFIQQFIQDNDLDERGYFIYHGVGTNDTVKSQSIDMAEEMLSRSDIFTPDHYVFYQREGGQHDHISCREFISSATLTTWNGEDMGAAQVLANIIHNHTRSDLFSIRTEVNYPLEYNDLADYAKDEQDNDVLPALTSHIENLDQYSTIIVVFPDWWYTMPQAVYSFFDEYDLAGKTIIPCSTHAGSYLTGSPATIRELEPDATIIDDGFTVAANRVTTAEDDVTAWAEKHELT